jgi:hypothetical protein
VPRRESESEKGWSHEASETPTSTSFLGPVR